MKAQFVKIGNSRISILGSRASFESSVKGMRAFLNRLPKRDDRIYFISVVPALSRILERKLKGAREIRTSDLRFPLAYRQGLGVDRAFNIFAASKIFSKRPVLVVDFGTAITLDFWDGRRHRGGYILPGVGSALRALSERTALLPDLSLVPISKLDSQPGRSTRQSMLRGRDTWIRGFLGASESEALRIFKTRGFQIVCTGGEARGLRYSPAVSLRQVSKIALLQLRGLKYLIHEGSPLR